MDSGEQKHYRVHANMMKTGFFISPLVVTNEDFIKLFDPRDTPPPGARVRSIRLEVSGDRRLCWERSYSLKFKTYLD
jgi:hypothetical protein